MGFLEYAKDELGINLPVEITRPDDINKVLPLLRYPLDENAIQESKAGENGKTYNMKGYSYQAHIDRMNDIFGVNWRFELRNEQVDEVPTWNNQRAYYCHGDMVVSIGYFRRNEDTRAFEWTPIYSVPSVPTGHENTERDSARKGAQTKGIKRATSILGVGADAYLGILDDDMSTSAPVLVQQEGEEKETQRSRYQKGVEWDQQQIGEKEFNGLMLLAEKKGLNAEKLRSFYAGKSDGEIAEPPSMLKKGELTTVKMMLGDLPDYVPPIEEERQDNQEEDRGRQWPMNQEELLLVDDGFFREIASEFSLEIPPAISAKNRGALCKTLWMLMENKRKAEQS